MMRLMHRKSKITIPILFNNSAIPLYSRGNKLHIFQWLPPSQDPLIPIHVQL